MKISILIGCTPLHNSMLSHLVCVEHYDSRNFELSNSISSSAVNVLQSSSPEVLQTNGMLSCNGVPIKILTFSSKPTKHFVKPGQYNSWTCFFSLAWRHLTIDKTWCCSCMSSCWLACEVVHALGNLPGAHALFSKRNFSFHSLFRSCVLFRISSLPLRGGFWRKPRLFYV